MERKIIGLLIGAAIGWVVKQAVAGALEEFGVPADAATAAGAVIGAIVA